MGRARFANRAKVAGSAAAIIALLAGSSVVITALPASAASLGAGWDNFGPLSHLGAYVAGGESVYCIEPGASSPLNQTTSDAGMTGSVNGNDSLTMVRVNYLISAFGQTGDNDTAAAVAMAVWSIGASAEYAAEGGDSFVITRAPAANRAHIRQLEANFIAAANAYTPSGISGGGFLTFSVDNNNYTGSVTVNVSPSNAVGSVTLTSGVFTASGSATANGLTNGSTLAVKGAPPATDATYEISGSGTFSATGATNYNGQAHLYTTGSSQLLLGQGGTYRPTTVFNISGHDPFARSTVFSPIVTSSVETRFVADDSAFTDTLEASVAAGSQPWRQTTSGRYVPVVANGTLYGPFADQPTTSATVPPTAPVAGTATVTLDGPGQYTAPSVITADHTPGFYQWVWNIDAVDSSAGAQLFMPADYQWADQFGLQAEAHVVAAKLSGVSKVSDDEVGFGHAVSDALTVTLDLGPWPTIGGAPVPTHFQNKAYWVKGDTVPTPSDTVPDDAGLFHTTDVNVTAPGDYHSDEIKVPPTTAGYLVNVWSIVQDGPGDEYFTDWTDGWAADGEVTKVSPPKVSTEAIASVALGDETNDTATIDGPIPAPFCGTTPPADGETSCPNTVTFAAYLQKDLGDQPVCEPSNEVFNTGYTPEDDQPTTDIAAQPTPSPTPTASLERDPEFFFNKPVSVDEAGRYPSADVIFREVGVYYFVATFRTGDGTVIHTGECGDQKEKTVVAEDDVMTKATPRVGIGQKGHDTAIVTGVIPKNGTIEFAVFKQRGSTPVCTASNEVKVGKPQPLPATGEYASADYTFTEAGTFFWVETVRNARGEITHQGECGADGETTIVDALAKTGSDVDDAVPALLGGLVLTLLGMSLIGYVKFRRQRTNTSK